MIERVLPALLRLRAGVTGIVTGAATTEHGDADIVFVMPVFRDAPVADASLRRLRRHYPGARVVLISDGDPGFPGDAMVRRHRVEYALGENLYGMTHGGALIHRFLSHYMERPARWLVRMDTDARIDRRFAHLPGRMGVHGAVNARGNIQGGCIVLTHDAAARLHGSSVFLDPRLTDPGGSWARFMRPDLLERKMRLGTVSYEKVLRWGCEAEGIPLLQFPEIWSTWKAKPENAKQRANAFLRRAIVHPDRMEGEHAAPGAAATAAP